MDFKHIFKRTPIRVGSSWAVTIPAQYIEDGTINPSRPLHVGVVNDPEHKDE